jgi:hypothetical protein
MKLEAEQQDSECRVKDKSQRVKAAADCQLPTVEYFIRACPAFDGNYTNYHELTL